jgi:hypothetical protein
VWLGLGYCFIASGCFNAQTTGSKLEAPTPPPAPEYYFEVRPKYFAATRLRLYEYRYLDVAGLTCEY